MDPDDAASPGIDYWSIFTDNLAKQPDKKKKNPFSKIYAEHEREVSQQPIGLYIVGILLCLMELYVDCK